MSNFLEQLNLTSQERRIVIAIGSVVILVLNYLFIWPQFSEWGRIQKQLKKDYATIEEENKEIALDRNPTNEFYTQLVKLERLEKSSPRIDAVQVQLPKTIGDLAMKNGVTVNAYQPVGSRTPQTNEYFEEQSEQITIESQEPQLVNFLYQIGNDPSMIRVSELDLHPADVQNRYRLRGSITLTANYAKRAPAAAPAKPSKPGPPGAKAVAGAAQPAAKPPAGAGQPKPPAGAGQPKQTAAPKPGGPPSPGQPPVTRPQRTPLPAPVTNTPIRKNL